MIADFTPHSGAGDLDTNVTTLTGWCFTEDAGTPAAAALLLRVGDASGAIIAMIRLPASGMHSISLDHPLKIPAGVFIDVTLGNVRGSLFGTGA
jgi:hypothetical protein